MDFFPLFARLKGQPVLVVGGGTIAARKIRLLRRSGARVTVNAPALDDELAALADAGHIRHAAGPFDQALVDEALIVVAATDDTAVNARVYEAATARNKLVNTVDDPARCTFITPSIVDRSPMIIAISSGGQAPVLARRIREWLEARLPQRLGALAAFAGRLRDRVKAKIADLDQRRYLYERLFDGSVADHVLAGREGAASAEFETMLQSASRGGRDKGEVWLVGAGPGDPSLLTLRALQLMQRADVILHDRLVSADILELARRDAEMIPVGKVPGGPCTPQDKIIDLLLDHARAGQRVLRLKGGDPFVFGRGGEEMEALIGAGVDFQVVPGITAAQGCAAYAGIPLTHRDHAHAVTFVTGHDAGTLGKLDPAVMRDSAHTVAIYMGLGRAASIAETLIAAGRPAGEPVAIIQDGTTADQRVVRGTLAKLPVLVAEHGVRPPALVVIGRVAALADKGSWFVPSAGSDEQPWQDIAAAAV